MKFDKIQKNRLKRLILNQFHKILEVYAEHFDQYSVIKTLEVMGFRCLPEFGLLPRGAVCIEAVDIIHHFGRPSRIDSLLNKYEYHWETTWVKIPKDVALHALTLEYLPFPDEWANLVKEHLKISKRISLITKLLNNNQHRSNSKELREARTQLEERQEKIGQEIARLANPVIKIGV